MLSFLFGKPVTPQDVLQRNVDRIDEITKRLKRDRDRLLFDLDIAAREAEAYSAVRQPLQKKLRLREQLTLQRNIDLLTKELERVQSIRITVVSARTDVDVEHILQSTTRIIERVNAASSAKKMQEVTKRFKKTRFDSEQKREMIDDAVEDDAEGLLDDDGEELDKEERLDKMFNESLYAELPDAASSPLGAAAATSTSTGPSRSYRPGERLTGWN